jgi:hypothetical protein
VNKRQTLIVRHFLSVIIVTGVVVFTMINLRDALTQKEAVREMSVLSAAIREYRQKNGSLPPESWVKPHLEGFARVGGLEYRAQWVLYDSPPDTILAFVKQKSYSVIVKTSYIVLKLNGEVTRMAPKDFDEAMKKQQSDREVELYRLLRKSTDNPGGRLPL